jgi:hypothetical protein
MIKQNSHWYQMMADNKVNSLLDQDDAMESYFVGLLSTLDPEYEKDPSANGLKLVSISTPAKDSLPTEWEADVDEAERLEAEKAEAARLETEKAEATRLKAEQAEATRLEAAQAKAAALEPEVKIDISAPSWVTHKFTALVGSVNNMNLTFPSSAISGELEFSNDLKSVKGQPEWVLGLKVSGKDFIAVIDAGKVMLDQPVRDIHKKPYKKIILLSGTKWGIALDSISTEIEISASNIKWRKSSSERPWLCGFLSEQQLAIVDPTKIFTENK